MCVCVCVVVLPRQIDPRPGPRPLLGETEGRDEECRGSLILSQIMGRNIKDECRAVNRAGAGPWEAQKSLANTQTQGPAPSVSAQL